MDQVDWCAKAVALQDIYENVRNGKAISEGRYGEDFMKYQNADLDRIERDLNYAKFKCKQSQSGGKKKRRYALGVKAF